MKRECFTAKPTHIDPNWHIVDAEGVVLGRLATKIASTLRGKHKPTFTQHMDTGDFVVVINADKIRLTGKKLTDKTYWRHSGYLGGIKSMQADEMLKKHPTALVEKAVKGMLPRGPLGRKLITKLKVYQGSEHPHTAQKPNTLQIS